MLLVAYNLDPTGPGEVAQQRNADLDPTTEENQTREAYGPSLEWLDRLARASDEGGNTIPIPANYHREFGQSQTRFFGDVVFDGRRTGFGFQIASRQLVVDEIGRILA